MTYKGFVKTGQSIDSKRDNWEDTKDYFGFTPYNGTLNIYLEEKVNVDGLEYEFELFDWFRFTKAVLKFQDVEKEVYAGFKFNMPVFPTFFIVSDVKLRDELNLKDGDKVEVTL